MKWHARPRRIVLAALLGILISAEPAMAQTSGTSSGRSASSGTHNVSFGVIGGVSAAHMSLPIDTLSAADLSAFGLAVDNHHRAGFAGGVFVDVPAASLLSFEGGALVSLKGTAIDVTTSGVFESGTFRLMYLDLPFLACADLLRTSSRRLSVLAGPTVGINVSTKTTGAGNRPFVSDDLVDLPRMDYSLTIAGRTQIRHVLFEVRYDHGLKNLASSTAPPVFPGFVAITKNRSLHFMTGFRF